ncbi:AbiH family protein [Sphingobacterium corticis]|uniref:AbiH family protein n=1 Tax=Sphingobacterium corticis TaxID=1812823 RepID=A0ABW5NIS8_9SPHI
MNKLIIVGNGFDIHNGIKSQYKDFLEWYLIERFREAVEKGQSITTFFEVSVKHSLKYDRPYYEISDPEYMEIIRKTMFQYGDTMKFDYFVDGELMLVFNFKYFSAFFREIAYHFNDLSWVDIEMIYYQHLSNCLEKSNNLDSLNEELRVLKNRLCDYLRIACESKKPSWNFKVCADASIDTQIVLDQAHINRIEKEYGNQILSNHTVQPSSTMFLNFNYTGLTHQIHCENYSTTVDIHGSLFDKKNIPIFGYGDEIGDEYIMMEKTNDNRFFEHIKSFGYFNTSNYSDLLRFLDSKLFVVNIWGHSCGLSDRTLLNEIFEHNNCCAIQPYYWNKGYGDDNYTEIAQNISRHFRNKQKLRNRLVDKTKCFPLGS